MTHLLRAFLHSIALAVADRTVDAPWFGDGGAA